MKLTFVVAGALLCAGVFAQSYSTDFNAASGYVGSSTGTVVTGQNGWYNPVAGSLDGSIFTYANNSLAFPQNPLGGDQFLGGTSQGGTAYVRAQHPVAFNQSGLYSMSTDMIGAYVGTPGGASEYLGSASLQPSTSANYFQFLYQWGTHLATNDFFDAMTGHFTSAGSGGGGIVFDAPSAAFQGLPVNHWYRHTTVWDYNTNQIVAVSIQDLTAAGPFTAVDVTGLNWFLSGGANNSLGQAAATDVRYFVGGANAGNTAGYDNLNVGPVPTVFPTGYQLFRGLLISGGLSDLFQSDNSYLVAGVGFVLSPSEAPVQLIVTGTSPVSNATYLSFKMEAHASETGLGYTVSLFDYSANAYVDVATGATPTSDTVVSVVATNPNRFVQPGTGQVRARMAFKAAGPLFAYPWRISFDQTVWTIA